MPQDKLNEERSEGSRLALALVDHLRRMGNAGSAYLPVQDRDQEYVVIVMTKEAYVKREWPIEPQGSNVGDDG